MVRSSSTQPASGCSRPTSRPGMPDTIEAGKDDALAQELWDASEGVVAAL